MQDETKIRIANMLLGELKLDKDDWWYISIISIKEGVGGCIIKGKGPTDAWLKAHKLMLIPPDSTTNTMGPIEAENIKKVPEDKRWRYLTEEEVTSIQ